MLWRASQKCVTSARLLLAIDPSMAHTRSYDDKTPLILAMEQGRSEFIRMLRESRSYSDAELLDQGVILHANHSTVNYQCANSVWSLTSLS